VAQPARSYVVFPPSALATAEQVAAVTPPRALVLHAPTHDTPILLTGRRSLLGYEGPIWSQGLDKGRRAEVIQHIYEGRPAAVDLLREVGADFIFVGGQERARYDVDESFLARLPLAAEGGSYRIYRVR
jgi:hypothetical protein